jgi:epoxyqueuosine reductase
LPGGLPLEQVRRRSRQAKLQARPDLLAPRLAELARLDDAAFRQRFSGSPIKRIGRGRFVRNVLIAIGNSGEPSLAAEAERLLDEPDPTVRGAAVWALSRLLAPASLRVLAEQRAGAEPDEDVRGEWRSALAVAA